LEESGRPADHPGRRRAELYLVDGDIGHAGRVVTDVLDRRPGYQNVATLREPYRIEGKKTMGLEIAEQLGWRMPDVIVYPAGGGVGIIGIYKALRELLELGWVTGDLPRLVAVQPDGSAPIVKAFLAGATDSEAWPDPKTGGLRPRVWRAASSAPKVRLEDHGDRRAAAAVHRVTR
jgi:threonine synthase